MNTKLEGLRKWSFAIITVIMIIMFSVFKVEISDNCKDIWIFIGISFFLADVGSKIISYRNKK